MQLKSIIKQHKNLILIAIIIIVTLLTWTFMHSFSEDVSDSAWDGVIADHFTSGTGTANNPYIISNASEYAYFKTLLEGDSASLYAAKNYSITNGFNYGEYDISINNDVPFTGTINGNYNLIYNATVTNSFIKSASGAVIKNINFDNITVTVNTDTGILINEMEECNISAVSLYSSIEKASEIDKVTVAGIALSDADSMVKDVVIGVNYEDIDYLSLMVESKGTEFDNVIVDKGSTKVPNDVTADLSKVYEIDFGSENVTIDNELVSQISNDEYLISVINNKIVFESTSSNTSEQIEPSNSGSAKGPNRSPAITVHASGIDTANHIIYINDLVSDYNYYMGRNYTQISNTNGTIPTGNNQNKYSNSNLATVYIRYSGADINDSTVYGTVSVTEAIRDYYYYKRYPVENGYLTFDLIDNPWANRPNGMAFNGWVTDYTGAVVSLDIDTYTRSVKIPVSDISTPISITFYSSWTVASVATSTSEISTELKSATMTAVPGDYGTLTNYYISDHISYGNSYPTGLGTLYNMSGTRITRSTCNNYYSGCSFVKPNTSNVYDSTAEYYNVTPNGNNATLTQVYPTKVGAISYYDNNAYVAGLFVRVTSGTENIYSQSGQKLTSCGSSCYKLLQYSDGTVNNNTTYYYLTTRDTNIFAPSTTSAVTTGNIATTVPMTITGINNGTDNSSNRLIQLSNNWELSSDIRVEFIRFYVSTTTTTVSSFGSGNKIIGNYKNLKLGRGLKQYVNNNNTYLTATAFVGANANSTSSVEKYTLIVESGFYQNGSATGYSDYDHHVNATAILGSDYDRIAGTNDNLIVYYCYAGSWGSSLYSTSSSSNTYEIPATYTIIKSGSFGTNKVDYAAGVYVGGRAGGTHYALREALVEGGYIYNLIGGPASDDSRASKNDIMINVKGGEIDLIIGGAGASNTVGNRILNVTGGTINYSVLGGSNANEYSTNTSNPYGKIDGDTLVYVGGNVTVGTKNDTLFTVSSGDVYGAGNGRTGELDVGAVNNSHVIIGPEADINGDVYGGGNNGAVGGNTTGTYSLEGGSSSSSSSSGVYEDGTTDNNIRYYGANPDNYIQFGSENYRIIGLFNNVDTGSGTKNLVRIIKPTASSNSQAWANTYITSGNNRYYSNYYVSNENGNPKSAIYTYLNTTFYNSLNATYRNYIQSVDWGLAGTDTAGKTAATFYGLERGNTAGSNYSLTSYNYNIGLFYPSDYGFATNESTCLSANLTTYGNNSTCTGSNWMKSIITRDSWTMTPSTYYDTSTSGSGYNRRTNYRYYGFYLGSNGNLGRNRIYYNSYNSYAVFPSFYLKDDVRISSGSGTSTDPYVIGSTGDRLVDIVYEVMHPTTIEPDEPEEPEIVIHEESDYQCRTHIEILGGDIAGSVYGAGNNNGAGNNTKGSNGRVALAKVTIDMKGGKVGESIYGGANAEETVYGDVFINIENGDIGESVYGGGKGGYDNNSNGTYVACNVNVNIGDSNTTSLTIHDSVYGGSAFGSVNTINQNTNSSSYGVTVTVKDGTIVGSVFGGGEGDNSHTPKVVGPITVNIEGGDITNVYGGNDQAGEHTTLNRVFLTGGVIDNVYGGGNRSSVDDTHVYLDGASVTTIYGGSKSLGDVDTTTVEIKSGSVHTVYGGNDSGGTCGITSVKVVGTATVTSGGAIYGGGRQVNTTTANVTLTSAGATIPNVYGGGKSASVGTANIIKNGTTVTNLFGGSDTTGTVTVSNIEHNAGTTTALYGGNNAGGNTLASRITMTGGTVTTMYGGGYSASGDTSTISMTGGTVTTMFGGGSSAGLDSSSVTVTGGSVTTIYGGSYTTGTVDETHVTYNNSTGTVSNIYGGGMNAQVGDTSVTFTSGTATNIYGGGKNAQATGDTLVDINGGTITTVYGGGEEGAVAGSTNVTITDANVLGNAYAGGNGTSAAVTGNTTITIDGDTVIGTVNSTVPDAGCVFGSGSRAITGTQASNNSTATVNIVGGTVYGNVYGGAKFAVVYGNTVVNIGQSAYTSQTLEKDDIDIKGHIFGGGEANSSGSSDIYDWSFISVTRGVNITIDGDTYTNFNIDGSFYGGGNASTASGDSYLMIRNYGTTGDPEDNISIQRVTYVTIENSSILLRGAKDRANDYDNEPFSISRVVRLKIKDNSEIYFMSKTNLLEEFVSVDENDQKAQVRIDTANNAITTRNVDNRIYIYERKNVNIAHDQSAEDTGSVSGMTFLGLFNFDNNGHVNNGIYNANYGPGATLSATGLFAKGGTVVGHHETNHDITVDGFYTNNMNSSTKKNEISYVQPSPDDASYYMWHVGANAIEYNLNLVASKYSTMGAKELSFLEFSQPNTSFNILSFESIGIAQGVSLVDRSNIPRIAATASDANNIFGLSLEASNSGWLTTGKTSFYTREPSISGVRYYEGENSTVAPSLLFYLYHSKNITEEKSLGTVSITIQAITKLDAISVEEDLLVVNVNMSTALFQTNDYEGAMAPGDKYELFMSTSTNISSKSKYSAYFALYGNNTNLYRTGYHRVLTSTFVFPENTKITMLDFINGVPQYYYHVMTAADVTAAEADYQANNNVQCAYALSMFTRMGSVSNTSNYDDAAKNAIYYDGTDSNEEFIFIVDFSDANITSDKLNQKLLIDIRDSNEEDIISVLGVQHTNLTYNVYANKDSQINLTVTESANPLYIGYNDIFDVLINYQNSSLSGTIITDTQYFDSKMGVQIYIKDNTGKVVSGTDLTGCYFLMDEQRYYPDISGYTHIKLADKVGNTRKWIIFNTENSSLGTGSYTFTFEAFASADGIYYSSGEADYENVPITVINSKYGLDPVINDETIIFNANNDKALRFTVNYSSRLDNPNIRLAMYRRKYDTENDTRYELVDFQDYCSYTLTTTNNTKEYLLIVNPSATNGFTYQLEDELLTGTYRLSFRLYDDDTLIGEVNRYIIIK